MKQGKPLIAFVIVLIAAALACYFLYYVWRTFQDPFTTTYAYEYVLNDSVEAEGLIVRSERVLSGSPGILDVTRGEGEQVAVFDGDTAVDMSRGDVIEISRSSVETTMVKLNDESFLDNLRNKMAGI